MGKNKTTEQFKQEVYNLVGEEYTVLGEYVSSLTKIKIRHNKCGLEYEIVPSDFIHKKANRCPICYSRKKTTEQFKQEVYDLAGTDYTVLGEYVNNRTQLKMKHNKCGHEYMVTPTTFLSGSRCPKCFGTPKKTTEQFKEEVYNLVGDEYTVLGEYINNQTKILIRHNKCNLEYEVRPLSFLNNKNTKCAICYGRKKNTKKFKEEVYNLVGDEYTVLGEYCDSKTKIKMKHNECSHEYIVTPANFLTGNRCPKCYGNEKKTHEQFKQEVYELVGNEYIVLGKYINTHTKIKIKHDKCGHAYKVVPANFLFGCRCPKCFGAIKKTTEQFKKEVYDLVGDEYTVLGEYINNRTKIKIKHNKCGHEYKVAPSKFLLGTRCPKCKESKGESTIRSILEQYSIDYECQYKFNECRHIQTLPFDFALFKENELKLLIEYDGELHYKSVEYFGGDKSFKLTQKRDNIKTQFCTNNNIPLLRIPYWEFDNINEIITNKLFELFLIQEI